jgi:hypothetical protein
MVPAGDPRAEASPFAVTCPEKGRARWIDSRNWSYDFDHDLPGGLRCRFRLRTGARTLSGRPLGGEREFNLSTGGPGSFARCLRLAGHRRAASVVLFVDAVPIEATVVANASFDVDVAGASNAVSAHGPSVQDAISACVTACVSAWARRSATSTNAMARR